MAIIADAAKGWAWRIEKIEIDGRAVDVVSGIMIIAPGQDRAEKRVFKKRITIVPGDFGYGHENMRFSLNHHKAPGNPNTIQ